MGVARGPIAREHNAKSVGFRRMGIGYFFDLQGFTSGRCSQVFLASPQLIDSHGQRFPSITPTPTAADLQLAALRELGHHLRIMVGGVRPHAAVILRVAGRFGNIGSQAERTGRGQQWPSLQNVEEHAAF